MTKINPLAPRARAHTHIHNPAYQDLANAGVLERGRDVGVRAALPAKVALHWHEGAPVRGGLRRRLLRRGGVVCVYVGGGGFWGEGAGGFVWFLPQVKVSD